MNKSVYAVIGNDRILIKTFLFNENGNILNPNESDLLNIFLQSPKVINISSLGYIPKLNTEYIDETFMSTDEDKERPLPDKLNTQDIRLFSLILGNAHAGMYGFSINSENGVGKAAILSSDPVIEVKTAG